MTKFVIICLVCFVLCTVEVYCRGMYCSNSNQVVSLTHTNPRDSVYSFKCSSVNPCDHPQSCTSTNDQVCLNKGRFTNAIFDERSNSVRSTCCRTTLTDVNEQCYGIRTRGDFRLFPSGGSIVLANQNSDANSLTKDSSPVSGLHVLKSIQKINNGRWMLTVCQLVCDEKETAPNPEKYRKPAVQLRDIPLPKPVIAKPLSGHNVTGSRRLPGQGFAKIPTSAQRKIKPSSDSDSETDSDFDSSTVDIIEPAREEAMKGAHLLDEFECDDVNNVILVHDKHNDLPLYRFHCGYPDVCGSTMACTASASGRCLRRGEYMNSAVAEVFGIGSGCCRLEVDSEHVTEQCQSYRVPAEAFIQPDDDPENPDSNDPTDGDPQPTTIGPNSPKGPNGPSGAGDGNPPPPPAAGGGGGNGQVKPKGSKIVKVKAATALVTFDPQDQIEAVKSITKLPRGDFIINTCTLSCKRNFTTKSMSTTTVTSKTTTPNSITTTSDSITTTVTLPPRTRPTTPKTNKPTPKPGNNSPTTTQKSTSSEEDPEKEIKQPDSQSNMGEVSPLDDYQCTEPNHVLMVHDKFPTVPLYRFYCGTPVVCQSSLACAQTGSNRCSRPGEYMNSVMTNIFGVKGGCCQYNINGKYVSEICRMIRAPAVGDVADYINTPSSDLSPSTTPLPNGGNGGDQIPQPSDPSSGVPPPPPPPGGPGSGSSIDSEMVPTNLFNAKMEYEPQPSPEVVKNIMKMRNGEWIIQLCTLICKEEPSTSTSTTTTTTTTTVTPTPTTTTELEPPCTASDAELENIKERKQWLITQESLTICSTGVQPCRQYCEAQLGSKLAREMCVSARSVKLFKPGCQGKKVCICVEKIDSHEVTTKSTDIIPTPPPAPEVVTDNTNEQDPDSIPRDLGNGCIASNAEIKSVLESESKGSGNANKIVTKESLSICETGGQQCTTYCKGLLGSEYLTATCTAFPKLKTCSQKICICRSSKKFAPSAPAIPNPSLACFSGDTQIITESGSKQISQLTDTDKVLVISDAGFSGNINRFEPVSWYLHKDPAKQLEFVSISVGVAHSTKDESVFLSAFHLIPVIPNCFLNDTNNIGRLIHEHSVFAYKVKVGQCLLKLTDNGSVKLQPITGVTRVSKKGVYSPLTRAGNLVSSNGIVMSCYSSLENHFLLRTIFNSLESVYQLTSGWTQYLFGVNGDPETKDVPYVVNYLMHVGGIVV